MYVSLGASMSGAKSTKGIEQISFQKIADKLFDALVPDAIEEFAGDVAGPLYDIAKEVLIKIVEQEVKEAIDASGRVTTLDLGLALAKQLYLVCTVGVEKNQWIEGVSGFYDPENEGNPFIVGGMTYLFGDGSEDEPGKVAEWFTGAINKLIEEVTGLEATIPEDDSDDDWKWDMGESDIPVGLKPKATGFEVVMQEGVPFEFEAGGLSMRQRRIAPYAPIVTSGEGVSLPVVVGGAAILAYLLLA